MSKHYIRGGIMKDLTVQQIANELALSRDTVKRLIETDELHGYNAAPRGAVMAAWRVTRDNLDAFKESRSGKPPVKVSRRKRVVLPQVIEFFK